MTDNMKKGIIALGLLASLSAYSQESYVPQAGEGIVYFLPKTKVAIDIIATKVDYQPGDFSLYASRYLRLNNISSQPESHWEIKDIQVRLVGVPDSTKAYIMKLKDKSMASNVELTDKGIVKAINTTSTEKESLPDYKLEKPQSHENARKYMTEDILMAGSSAKMAELTETGLVTSVDLMASYNEADAENVDILEKKVDHFEDALGTYLVKLSSEKLSPKDSQTLSMILHCIGDFERISDHTVNIMKAAREMHDKNLQFSADGAAELAVYGKAVKDIVSLTFSVFNNEDVKKANEVEPLEQVIDSLNSSLKNHHIERLQSGKCTIELGFILSDVMTDFERISDHCSNIAVCVSQIHSGSFDTHEYLHALKKEEEFEAEYKELKKQYQLPDVKA